MKSHSYTIQGFPSNRDMAFVSEKMVEKGKQFSSSYTVGSAVAISVHSEETSGKDMERLKKTHSTTRIYEAFNIEISGMETKVHAEQLALFLGVIDIAKRGILHRTALNSVMVMTSENDLALRCGHCIQVFSGFCEKMNWNKDLVKYSACSTVEGHGERYEYDTHTLDEFLPETYVEKR